MAEPPPGAQRHLVEAAHRAPWRDLPEHYGPWKTAHERLRKRTMDGTWEKILAHVVATVDATGAVEWTVSVDSTVARAHQRAAGAPKKGAAQRRWKPSLWTVKGWAGLAVGWAARFIWPLVAAACR